MKEANYSNAVAGRSVDDEVAFDRETSQPRRVDNKAGAHFGKVGEQIAACVLQGIDYPSSLPTAHGAWYGTTPYARS